MNEQRNLFLAIVLMMAVLFGWQYLVAVPRMQEEQAKLAEKQKTEMPALAPGVSAPQAALGILPRGEALAQSPQRVAIETPTLDGSINLTGARFDDLRLRQYRETPDERSPEIELLSPMAAEHPYVAEFGWIAAQGETQKMPNAETMWQLAEGGKLSPGGTLELTHDNGQGLTFTRRVTVDERYMFTVADTVTNNSGDPVTLSPYGLVMRRNVPPTTYYWVVHEGFIGVFNGTLDDPEYSELAEGNETRQFESTGGWLGITDKYWMAAVIPPQSEQFTGTYKAFDANGTKAFQSDFMLTPKTIAPNASQTIVHHFFAGAKVVDIVDGYAGTLGINRFDMAVDWGWFNPLTKWMFLALDYIYRFVGNYGVTILIFTVIVKLVFFPLANTSYRAMSKMKKLQPEMERLRERHKDDKTKMQQELMTLYQKEKVNPLAGCMPMLIQIPVFFSLYKVLLVTIDMRHAPFFGWIRDLSAAEPISLFNLFGLLPFTPPAFLMIGVFSILMGFTMWLQTNLNPPPADPVQAKMFSYMPILFVFMLANFPAGLVIYWTWNNVLSLAQQIYIMKSTGTPIDLFDRLRGMGARLKRGEPAEKPAGPPD
jgi:YidC/Oxa1 family membrane protein insertase